MLDLNSKRWETLGNAYDSRLSLPDLIRRLQEAIQSNTMFEDMDDLVQSVCHQYTIYPASYAAVPHLVHIAHDVRCEQRVSLLGLVGLVAGLAQGKSAEPVPKDLKADYDAALKRAASLVLECLAERWSDENYNVLLGALANLQGHPVTGLTIIEGIDEIMCNVCGEFFLSFGAVLINGNPAEKD